MNRRRTITMLVLAAPLGAAGCGITSANPAAPTFAFTLAHGVPVAAMAIAAPIAVAQRHGPTITIVNRSDTQIDARFWVAKIDVSKPAGHDVMETDDRLTVRVEPNELLLTNAGRSGWVTGSHDALVWIRLIPACADDIDNVPIICGEPALIGSPADRPDVEPTWLEFDRPGPYKIEVAGHFDPDAPNAGLTYRPLEDTTFKPLPRDAWIEHHDGHYPAP